MTYSKQLQKRWNVNVGSSKENMLHMSDNDIKRRKKKYFLVLYLNNIFNPTSVVSHTLLEGQE